MRKDKTMENKRKKSTIEIQIDPPTPKPNRKVNYGLMPPNLPQPLTLEEKKYLLSVERGDLANVRRTLQKAHRKHHININCMDPLGRRAISLAIDGENLEMLEFLVVMGVETQDALLHAINVEFVEAVELLLEHEELIHNEGELYSWQKVDITTAMFTPDITPLILAAHRNNFELLKILLDRGAAVPVPHEIKCGCDTCITESSKDSLRFSITRLNIYKALASPSLIVLTSNDPLLTAFHLSWELRTLALAEQECKTEYMELHNQCQKFAVSLLDQTRMSEELDVILNYEPESSPYSYGDKMVLSRLNLAVDFKQKKFVAHPKVQQLLASLWYYGTSSFRRKTLFQQFLTIAQVALLFPFYCLLYMFAPACGAERVFKKPFMKFLIHASSYLFFLFILILVSQRAENDVLEIFGSDNMKRNLFERKQRQRGIGPTWLELLVMLYVIGFIWEEMHEIFVVGLNKYLRNLWNFVDFLKNSLYISVGCLRVLAYFQQIAEIAQDPSIAYIPREQWNEYDPQLIAEGLFAAANIFSALKLLHMFSINSHLGPLQISLGRMVIDIVKFFSIYSLVLFAFACGLNQLLWYFASLEKQKCFVLPNNQPDWSGNGVSCMRWRRFGTLFESSQSLFWASFGMIELEDFELAGVKSYTRFWGLLMFGSYSVINVIVLLNLLIAMMSNSYALIEHSDTEWKYARTKLWMSYLSSKTILPPPFNILPSIKWLTTFCKRSKKITKKESLKKQTQQENRYKSVMQALIWRYVSSMNRKPDKEPATEDDIHEIKVDISTLKYDFMEIFERNGMDISCLKKQQKHVQPKKSKIWERRLLKDFQVKPANVETEIAEPASEDPSTLNTNTKEKFKQIACRIANDTAAHKWNEVLNNISKNSQIGKCNNQESYKNQQNLYKAMQGAKKLLLKEPDMYCKIPEPVEFENQPSASLIELIKEFHQEEKNELQSNVNLAVNDILIKKSPKQSPEINMAITPPPMFAKDNSKSLPKIQINHTDNDHFILSPRNLQHKIKTPLKFCKKPAPLAPNNFKKKAKKSDEIRMKSLDNSEDSDPPITFLSLNESTEHLVPRDGSPDSDCSTILSVSPRAKGKRKMGWL